ncbi:MAG: cytochrome C biogenesis protein [Nocardioidaceae bacterium]|nr:cytochrome C biogenesis protein [Nocardioidaceae bacterium]
MSQLVFAYGVGMLALVSPCGFMMLPAFLAYNIADSGSVAGSRTHRLSKGLAVGLAVSAGFAGTFLVGGLLVSAGLRSLTDAVPWFGVVVGSLLLVLGLGMLAGRSVRLNVPLNRLARPGTGTGRTVAFGAGYALTQLACGMGGLLAVVAQGMANSSIAGTAGVFVAFIAGATSLLVLLALSSALMSDALVRGVRQVMPIVGRISGAVLAVSGAYLVVYWAPALFGGAEADNPASRFVHKLSADSRSFLQDNQLLISVAAVLLVATTAAAILRGRRAETDIPRSEDEHQDVRL